jgi:hypothetical protein
VDPTLYSNRSYSLAIADGPYGMLLPTDFFTQNPGIPYRNSSIGFQPEIGSVSFPTYRGLQRVLEQVDIESGMPNRLTGSSNNTAWVYHKFLPWTTPVSEGLLYDHVYAYFGSDDVVTARDWVAAAQLAAHAQYQNLFNGFISNIFKHATAVILWKSQSPWPSLRGFLYDWYLESTGTLQGVRAALHCPISIVFDPMLWRLHLVNRSVRPLVPCESSPIGAHFQWVDLHGGTVGYGVVQTMDSVPAMSSTALLFGDLFEWPIDCTEICFLRLQLLQIDTSDVHVTWYWLTNPAKGETSHFYQLGELRFNRNVHVSLEVRSCVLDLDGLEVDLQIKVGGNSRNILFYPTLAIEAVTSNKQLLPVFDESETDIVITPGSEQRRRLRSLAKVDHGEAIRVVLSSWNAPEMSDQVVCASRGPSAYIA